MEVVEMVVKELEMEWKKRTCFPNLFSFFLLLLIFLFSLLFLLPFSFFFSKDTSKFQKNIHEIRMWRIFWF